MMTDFKHFVSLGHFCSVAMDLEALGLREASLPFDWNIDLDLPKLLDCIRNGFDGFLEEDELEQSREDPSHYMNRYGVQFFHDFDPYRSLAEQLPAVQEKYRRRISRFYETVKEPTLFLRYITDAVKDAQGEPTEVRYLQTHYDEVLALLRSFNPANDLLLIANEGCAALPSLYTVRPDAGDIVARTPRRANPALGALLSGFSVPNQAENRRKGARAARRRKLTKLRKALARKLPHKAYYRHEKQY